MRLPRLFRTTPFRLTLLFLAVFAAAASGLLAYIYVTTAGEVTRTADRQIAQEMGRLQTIYARDGQRGLNQAIIERAANRTDFLYLLQDADGQAISGSIHRSPIARPTGERTWSSFQLQDVDAQGQEVRRPARGLQVRLSGGEILFVGEDIGEARSYVVNIVRALWGAGALVLLLGLIGGTFISRDVSRHMAGLIDVTAAARGGDLSVRARVRGARDEYDDLAEGLNEMLDRLERTMSGLRHAGDAIAHDLRSPLTRIRARLESALIEADAGRGDARQALSQALEDVDGVLTTFNTVLAIARLEAAVDPPNPSDFDAAGLASDMAELYGPLSEDQGLDFQAELTNGLVVRGSRQFVAQALANILDNAVKYTPSGGAVCLRARRRSSGEVELSVTDTGPGVPEADRERMVLRFVRLENSRNAPGSGLGLSLVQAVAASHGGRLEIAEGPGDLEGVEDAYGPGLRVALVLPAAGV
jgi:signal transduction histidine kinase